jgi:hypothetical protein
MTIQCLCYRNKRGSNHKLVVNNDTNSVIIYTVVKIILTHNVHKRSVFRFRRKFIKKSILYGIHKNTYHPKSHPTSLNYMHIITMLQCSSN